MPRSANSCLQEKARSVTGLARCETTPTADHVGEPSAHRDLTAGAYLLGKWERGTWEREGTRRLGANEIQTPAGYRRAPACPPGSQSWACKSVYSTLSRRCTFPSPPRAVDRLCSGGLGWPWAPAHGQGMRRERGGRPGARSGLEKGREGGVAPAGSRGMGGGWVNSHQRCFRDKTAKKLAPK